MVIEILKYINWMRRKALIKPLKENKIYEKFPFSIEKVESFSFKVEKNENFLKEVLEKVLHVAIDETFN